MEGEQKNATNFNPRPLAGATTSFQVARAVVPFQSTPPCGGDRLDQIRHLGPVDFNPRPLAGATIVVAIVEGEILYFNPRPLAGATADGIYCPVH